MLSGRRRRAGLSLAEVVAVVAILSLVVAAVAGVTSHHQRRFADLTASGATRAQLREGAALLSAALRDVSPAAGDLHGPDLLASAISFRSTVGTFVVCALIGDGESRLSVIPADDAPQALAPDPSPGPVFDLPNDWGPAEAGAREASAGQPPAAGDSLLLYDPGARLDGSDDRWVASEVVGVSAAPTCFGRSVRASYILSLSASPPRSLAAHAPARVFRRTRLGLYSSADGTWQLGASECLPNRASPCASWQPVSGPYRPPAAVSGAGGLELVYLDRSGNITVDPGQVARIDAALRIPRPSAELGIPSTSTGTIAWTIPLRNGRP